MLELEPTGQRCPVITGSGRNGLDLKHVVNISITKTERAVVRPIIKRE